MSRKLVCECVECGALFEWQQQSSCAWCGGTLTTATSPSRSERPCLYDPLAIEASEDPDQRPYLWED